MVNEQQMQYLLPHMLENAANLNPNHVALRHRDASITYGDLFSRSSQLANALIADGVEPGERIGILMNKGIDAVVALWGIMAAGAAYVPLDPTAPSARVAFVIRDCGIVRVMSHERKRKTLEEIDGAGVPLKSVWWFDPAEELPYPCINAFDLGSFATHPPDVVIGDQDLCYILYTSGSTGTPKGIMHTHRSARSWAEVTASVYDLSQDDVVSNYAPLHFDLSTLDFFGGTKAAATIVIIPEEYTRFPASLAELLESEAVSVFFTVPLALVRLAAPGVLDGKDLRHLRLVLFGGEPMPVKHLRQLMLRLPDAQFVNVYGPTETNGCTHYVVDAVPEEDAEPLPIGQPYPNVRAIVVDADGRDVEPGEPGELLIRAPTMMRGYWARPDLNERAFVSRDPYGGLPDIYQATGDLAELRPDGNLRFLGRRDRQIKARGNRVELDEVEAVLMTHPAVKEAAIYTRVDEESSLQIHGSAILVEGEHCEPAELLDHMRRLLPVYAVPATLDVRSVFPRTSTGKIDRRSMETDTKAALSDPRSNKVTQ